MGMTRRLAFLYPVLLAVAFVLTKYLDEGVPIATATRAVIVAAVIAAGLTVSASVLARDARYGGLLGAVAVGLIVFVHEPVIALTLGVLAGLLVVDLLRTRRAGHPGSRPVVAAHRFLASFSVLLVAATVLQFGLRGSLLEPGPTTARSTAQTDHPDIWLVLLDGYPRADVLEEVWGWDASPFLDELRALGFDVSARSRSNYPSTNLTLPSLLHMSLLDSVPPFADAPWPLAAPAAERWRALQENRAFELLREHGYEIVSFGAGFSRVDVRSADRFVDTGTADVIEIHLLADTALRFLVNTLAPAWAPGEVRQRTEANLLGAAALARELADAPRFALVHVPSPHPPAVFAPDGSTPTAELEWLFHQPAPGTDPDAYRETYVANLAHLDGRVLKMVRDFLAATEGEAVIVLFSDHGSQSKGTVEEPTAEDVHEQYANLLAAYTPGKTALLGDDITLVNVLPVLFDAYLGRSLGRQPDLLVGYDGLARPNPDLSEDGPGSGLSPGD
jgi:hypothetical protein